jgi:hypothetical protein
MRKEQTLETFFGFNHGSANTTKIQTKQMMYPRISEIAVNAAVAILISSKSPQR